MQLEIKIIKMNEIARYVHNLVFKPSAYHIILDV